MSFDAASGRLVSSVVGSDPDIDLGSIFKAVAFCGAGKARNVFEVACVASVPFDKSTVAVLPIMDGSLVESAEGKVLTLGVPTEGIADAIVADVAANTAVACAGFDANTAVGKLSLETMEARFRDDREEVPFPESSVEFVRGWLPVPFILLKKVFILNIDGNGPLTTLIDKVASS